MQFKLDMRKGHKDFIGLQKIIAFTLSEKNNSSFMLLKKTFSQAG